MSIFGGKITTYRKLAEHALEKLQPVLGFRQAPDRPAPCRAAIWSVATSRRSWRAAAGGALAPLRTWRGATRGLRQPGRRSSWWARAGSATWANPLGDGLYEAEVDYLRRHEWAVTAEDILWRRSKLGLHVGAETVARLEAFLGQDAKVPQAASAH